MFQGFSKETVEFMWGIRFNNEREWFEENKESYIKHFYRPMQELGQEVYGQIRTLRPDSDLICKVSRIYRDARRLHGRGPYKDSLWFSIHRPVEQWTAKPTLWFELMPEGWTCGMGYYLPEPVTMMKLRARIDREPEKLAALMDLLEDQTEFRLDTQDYKRPKGTAPMERLAVWYRARSFSIRHEEKLTEELFSRELEAHILRDFTALLPFYDYFDSLSGEPDPREN